MPPSLPPARSPACLLIGLLFLNLGPGGWRRYGGVHRQVWRARIHACSEPNASGSPALPLLSSLSAYYSSRVPPPRRVPNFPPKQHRKFPLNRRRNQPVLNTAVRVVVSICGILGSSVMCVHTTSCWCPESGWHRNSNKPSGEKHHAPSTRSKLGGGRHMRSPIPCVSPGVPRLLCRLNQHRRLQACSNPHVLFFMVTADRSQVAKRFGGVWNRRGGEGEGGGRPLGRPGAARHRQQPENNSRDMPTSHRHGVS